MLANWKSNWYPAPDALAGVLAGIWSVHAAGDTDLSARRLPDGSPCLVFQRDGTVLRSNDSEWRPWATTCVSGPRTGPFDFRLGAGGHILIVQLLPAGAIQALGVPMSSLVNSYEEVNLVLGPESQRISEFVQGHEDEVLCVRAIEQWLIQRVRVQLTGPGVTEAAVHAIVQTAGSIRVDDLAQRYNLSRRHLSRMMSEHVGTSPKLFARLSRFSHALNLARTRPTAPWVQLALAAGYADQAHMTREFVDLGGIRPTDLRGPDAATIW